VLWRHGRTAWNDEDRFQGHTDVPLDDVGLRQVESAAVVLARLAPTALASSDLQRAAATADALARVTGLTVQLDARFRETNGGVWEGMQGSQIRASDGERFQAWRGGADVAAGGAESRSMVADRALAGLDAALKPVEPEGVLVVATHGGTARSLIGRVLGLPTERWRALGGLSNACWSVLEETPGGWRLAEHNAGSLPTPVVGDDR
jgi:probable phosphoglycerate mutase